MGLASSCKDRPRDCTGLAANLFENSGSSCPIKGLEIRAERCKQVGLVCGSNSEGVCV